MTRRLQWCGSASEPTADGGATAVRRAAIARTGDLQELGTQVMKLDETGPNRLALRRGFQPWWSATVGRSDGGESTAEVIGGRGLSPSSCVHETSNCLRGIVELIKPIKMVYNTAGNSPGNGRIFREKPAAKQRRFGRDFCNFDGRVRWRPVAVQSETTMVVTGSQRRI